MSSPVTCLYKNIIRHLYKKAFPQEYQTTRYGIVNIAGFGDNFKEFQMHNNMLAAIDELKQGLSEEEKELIDNKHKHFVFLPLKNFYMGEDRYSYFLTKKEQIEKEKWFTALPDIKKQYSFTGKYFPEVFFYHHGLKLLPSSAISYIKDKFFIDCGAFHGDSCIIMNEYSPAHVYALELLPSAKEILFNNLAKNNINPANFSFINCGVSNEESSVTLTDTKNMNTIKSVSNSGIEVPITTLDTLFKDRKNKIGWIKMDIEGAACNAIQGAINILKEDKPLLTVAIYHTPQEFFGIKPFIESLNLGYTFMIRNLNPTSSSLETTLICIPPLGNE